MQFPVLCLIFQLLYFFLVYFGPSLAVWLIKLIHIGLSAMGREDARVLMLFTHWPFSFFWDLGFFLIIILALCCGGFGVRLCDMSMSHANSELIWLSGMLMTGYFGNQRLLKGILTWQSRGMEQLIPVRSYLPLWLRFLYSSLTSVWDLLFHISLLPLRAQLGG